MPRLFFALELPIHIRRQLVQLQTPIPKARWQTEQNLHLTIRFLGQQPADCVAELQRVMALLPIPAFELTVQGLGCFGDPTKARVLWADIQTNPSLESLKQCVDDRLRQAGISIEDQPFRPHVTLARFPHANGQVETFLASHHALTLSFTVQYLSLFESSPGRDRHHYQVLWRTPLELRE